MTVLIQLTTAGLDTGPFNLYSNLDSFGTPFEVGVTKVDLLAGYLSSIVPNGTTTIRVCSISVYCANCIDITIEPLPTTTTTSSSSTSTSTTTSTSTSTSTSTTTSTSTSTTTSTTTAFVSYMFNVVLSPCDSPTSPFSVYSGSPTLGPGVSIWGDSGLTIPLTCNSGGPGTFCFISIVGDPIVYVVPDGSNVISTTTSC